MIPQPRERLRDLEPRLMIVEDDEGVGYAVSRWLQDQNVRPVLATSTREAMDILRDVVFIESRFDALLVDYSLQDATGVRVIQHFREEFPLLPVAVMTGRTDIALEIWARSRGILLFRKPLDMDELLVWVDGLRRSARERKEVGIE